MILSQLSKWLDHVVRQRIFILHVENGVYKPAVSSIAHIRKIFEMAPIQHAIIAPSTPPPSTFAPFKAHVCT